MPREFYERTLAWFSTSNVTDPGRVMEYIWHIAMTRGRDAVWPWGLVQNACLCYMYGRQCNRAEAESIWQFKC